MFKLDPRLEQSSVLVADLGLCQLRLVNDSQYPWLTLIPQRPEIQEVIDLGIEDQKQINEDSLFVATMLRSLHNPDKLNVASIGNHVHQCHIHHVARWKTDASWPDPIWGRLPTVPYSDSDLQKTINLYQDYLSEHRSDTQ